MGALRPAPVTILIKPGERIVASLRLSSIEEPGVFVQIDSGGTTVGDALNRLEAATAASIRSARDELGLA